MTQDKQETETNELIKSHYAQFAKIAFDKACKSFFDKDTKSLNIGENIKS